jgi:NB-ARC domain
MVDPLFAVWRASAGARRLGFARLREHVLPATATALADAFGDACAEVDEALSSGLGDALSSSAAKRSDELVDLAMVMMTAAHMGRADDFGSSCFANDPVGLGFEIAGTDAAAYMGELCRVLLRIVSQRARTAGSPLVALHTQVALDGLSRRLDLLLEASAQGSSGRAIDGATLALSAPNTASTLRLVDPRYRGRSETASKLVALLANGDRQCPIVSLIGMAGAGKSWLADVIVDALADSFDLAIRVNGRIGSSDSDYLLRTTIRHAGGDPETPDPTHEMARITRDTKLLILIDNARTSFDLTWLGSLPVGCAVVITSREPVSDAATAVERLYDVSSRDAMEILRARAPNRADDVGALMAISKRCGHLPLALGIVGSFAHRRPDVSWETIHQRMLATSPLRFLDRIAHADSCIRDAFSFSYAELDEIEASLFRALGCLEVDFIFEDLARAALPDVGADRLMFAFDGLVDAAMLEPLGGGEHTMHDLMREFGQSLEIEHGGRTAATVYNDRVLAYQLEQARSLVTRHRRPR